MQDEPNTHPGIDFCEKVCKKASEEGWKLALYPGRGFMWKKEIKNISSVCIGLDTPNMLHQACVELEKSQKWDVLQ